MSYFKKGQGSILPIFILATLMAMFSGYAGLSLNQRKKQEVQALRKLNLRNLEIKLNQALRSPSFVNQAFFEANPNLLTYLTKLSPNSLNLRSENFNDLKILSPAGTPWFGEGAQHEPMFFQNCNGADCALASSVTAQVTDQNAVGSVTITVKFLATIKTATPPFNSELLENQLKVSIPLNSWGVQMVGPQIFCKMGFKTLMVSQDPQELLCLVE